MPTPRPDRDRRATAILAAAGVALAASTTALGQADPRIIIDIENPDIATVGGSTAVRLFAQFDDASDYAIAGVATRLVSDQGGAGWSDFRLVSPMDGPGTSAGSSSATGVDGILAGQLNFPPAGIFADPTNPIAFWEATYSVPVGAGPMVLNLSTVTSRFDVYIDRDMAASESRLDGLTEGSGRITVTPAPASALVLLGLLAVRRRR